MFRLAIFQQNPFITTIEADIAGVEIQFVEFLQVHTILQFGPFSFIQGSCLFNFGLTGFPWYIIAVSDRRWSNLDGVGTRPPTANKSGLDDQTISWDSILLGTSQNQAAK